MQNLHICIVHIRYVKKHDVIKYSKHYDCYRTSHLDIETREIKIPSSRSLRSVRVGHISLHRHYLCVINGETDISTLGFKD